ncbi:MAG TPA: cobalamin biosynthesis protein [Methanoculleus sp.]|nr:cobalamin biosynthesis protein [Methanoculleus sp.]
MKLVIVAGPPSSGKTAVIRQIIRGIPGMATAYLKIDVTRAFEVEELVQEFGIPAKVVYSGDLCPDHAGVMVLADALSWAKNEGADLLIVESAGLCLRCAPYTTQALGLVVLSATSGIHTPLKMGSMVALADIAVITRTDLVSQAEKEVFSEHVREVNPSLELIETNAVQGTGMRYLLREVEQFPAITDAGTIHLRGEPPLGVCTICIGKKEIGWQNHFGVVRTLDGADYLYRGD